MRKYNNIPEVLKNTKKWVVWGKNGSRGIIPIKKPFNPKTNKAAIVTEPNTWTSYEEALKAVKNGDYCGLGYVFTNDYTLIDLDRVIDKNMNILPIAREIVEKLNSYTEYSMSRRGLHIILNKSDLILSKHRNILNLEPVNKMPEIEIYTTNRYVALTGDIISSKNIIRDNPAELRSIYKKYISPEETLICYCDSEISIEETKDITEEEKQVLERMFKGKNSARNKKLFINGDISNYPSQSEADLALCNDLIFYTDGNLELVYSIFKKSALYRDKSDKMRGEKTYIQKTIEKAKKNFIQV